MAFIQILSTETEKAYDALVFKTSMGMLNY